MPSSTSSQSASRAFAPPVVGGDGSGHFGCVVVNERPASIAFDMVASLPPARLCKDAWPLLSSEKRWRRSAIRKIPSAVYGVQTEGGRPGEVDEHVLAGGVSAAADAYAAIPDPLTTVAPFRSVLYQCTYQQRMEVLGRHVTDCLEQQGVLVPAVPPAATTTTTGATATTTNTPTAAGNRGATGRGGASAIRRGSAITTTTRRSSAGGRASGGTAAAAAAAAATQANISVDGSTCEPMTISTLLTCPTQKKEDFKVVNAVLHQVILPIVVVPTRGTDGRPSDDAHEDSSAIPPPPSSTLEAVAQSSVEKELGTLLHVAATSKGPKFHQYANAVLQVLSVLGAFMERCSAAISLNVATTPPIIASGKVDEVQQIWEIAGFCVLAVLRIAQRVYTELPSEAKALQELWYGRLIVPLLHLTPLFLWHDNHLRHLAPVLKSITIPESLDDSVGALAAPAATASAITSVTIDGHPTVNRSGLVAEDQAAAAAGFEQIHFDEHVQIDNRPSISAAGGADAVRSFHNAPLGSRLRQRSPSSTAATSAAARTPGALAAQPTSWSAYVMMPYASRISVTVHTATRCETLKVCLIPEDSASSVVTAEVPLAAHRSSEEEEDEGRQHAGHDAAAAAAAAVAATTTPQRPTSGDAEAVAHDPEEESAPHTDDEEHQWSTTPTSRLIESPVATECVTGVTARSAHALNEAGSVFVRCVGAGPYCHFQASVVGSVSLLLDTSCLSEARAALTHASLWVAEKLLESPTPVPASWLTAIRALLSGGGSIITTDSSASSGAGHLILNLSDMAIARSLRCRVSDAPKLRLIAAIAAHVCCLPSPQPSTPPTSVDTIMQSSAWTDIGKRCALYLERLSQINVPEATALATTLVTVSLPPKVPLSVTAALDAATQLLTSGVTCSDLTHFLRHRRNVAQQWVAGLTALTTTASRLQLREMHHVARVLRYWMRGGSSATTSSSAESNTTTTPPVFAEVHPHHQHYLTRIIGCGDALSLEVRNAFQRLLSYLFQSLCVAIRRMTNSSCRSHPHRYVMADAEDGTLVMLTLSLLTAPLDTKDVAFVSQSRIAEQLLEVMPNFTEFGRTNSFRVDEENEAGMATLLQTLVDQWQTFGAVHPATSGSASSSSGRRSSRRGPSSGSSEPRNTFPHAQRGQNGAWMISSASRNPWNVAKYPILDVDSLAAASSANDDGRPTSQPGSFPFVEVAVKCPPSAGAAATATTPPGSSSRASSSAASQSTSATAAPFIVALVGCNPSATPAGTDASALPTAITSARTMPAPEEHAGSFFIHFDGGLTITDDNLSVTKLPWIVLQDEDVLGLGCSFNARTQRWELHLWLNGIRLAVSNIHAPLLFLGVGVGDRRQGGAGSGQGSQQHTTVEVSFCASEVHERVWHQSCLEGLGKALLLPTQHEVALYASHAYVVLMSRCARLVSKWRRAAAASSSATEVPLSPVVPMSPISSGAGTFQSSGFQQHAFHALIEGGSQRLCDNIHAVVAVLEQLPSRTAKPASSSSSSVAPTARLKALAAQHVYNTLLLYWVGALRVLSRIYGFHVETVAALGRVVTCESLDVGIRLTTMQLLSSALDDMSLVAQISTSSPPPEELWSLCVRQSAQTTSSVYTPRFTETTIGPKLMLEESGKTVATQPAHRNASNVKNSAYGLPSIPIIAKADMQQASSRLLHHAEGHHSNNATTSKSDVVSFSIRMARSGRTGSSLGRYYFAGAIGYPPTSANNIFTDYMRGIGDRCFLLPDYASEVPTHMNKSELERYRRHWLTPGAEGSNADAVIFGSGDLITVLVDTKKRTIAFQRNSLPLGILYQDLKAEVMDIYPFVCLYNGDATATFQTRPSEVGIRSRVLVRQLLRAWPESFAPKLLTLIDDRDPVSMRVLQSDGNDLVVMQRAAFAQSTSSSSNSSSRNGSGTATTVTTAPRYHFVRLHGDHVEATDADGRNRYFPADSIVPDYSSETTAFYDIPADTPVLAAQVALKWRNLFLTRLIDVVSGSVMDDGEGCICVLAPRVSIRALRLICQLPFDVLSSLEENQQQQTLQDLTAVLQILAQMEANSTAGSDAKKALHSAWTELDTLDEHQAVFHVRSEDKQQDDDAEDADIVPRLGSSSNTTESAEGDSLCPLNCPSCGGPWGSCDHAAPVTYCELLDAALRRQSIPSAYSGWRGSWSEPATSFEWELQQVGDASSTNLPRVEVSGTGSDSRGRFTFTGHIVDRYLISGVIEYQAFVSDGDSPTAASAAEESHEWACDACTFLNPNDSSRCGVCGSGRPGSTWPCQICTYAFNATDAVSCMMCGTRRVVEDRRPADSTQHKARCIGCRGVKNFTGFESFSKLQDCPACGIRTQWLPEDTFTATVKGNLTTQGDVMEVHVRVGGGTAASPNSANTSNAAAFSSHKLKSHAYTYDVLRSSLKEEGDAQVYHSLQHSVLPLPTMSLKKVMAAHKADIKKATSAAAAGGVTRLVLPAALGLPQGMFDGDHEAVLRMLSARLGFTVEGAAGAAAAAGSPSGSPTSPNAQLDCTESVVRSAVQMLASRALLSWLPGLIQTGVFSVKAAGAVVAKLQHAEDSWMREWSNALSKEQIEGLLESTLHALHHSQDEGQTIPSSVSSVAALGTVALHLLSIASLPRERVTQLRGVLVAGLARGCSTWRSVHRDRMLSSLLSCFESFRGDSSVNTTPVLKLLSQQPTLHNQQRLTIFAALHAVESGQRHAAVTAANWVTHALHHMNQGKPLAQFFDRFHPDHAPHLVVLPDTKLNDNGELMVGQVRGSVAVYPNRGGKYYYEMVLPPNYSDRQKTIVMGWGSKLHEVQGSSQHVGSDFHSWGFNGRNRIRLLTGEQEIAVPHNTVSGDVIGSLLDLERKQMCWSINGELLQWVDIPLQGDGEPIYPYVSASVDPHFVLVLLNETQYLPEGFTEFTSNLDDPNLREASTTAPPQSFTFYKELTSLVNELSNSGLRIEELVVVRDVEVDAATPLPVDPATDYVDRSIALLPQYPHICNYLLGALDSIRGTTTPSDCEEEEVQRIREVTLRSLSRCDLDATIIPYLRHLFCLNAMSTVVAKRTDLIRDSPFLWGLYHQARDLLFFSARWALIDVHLSRKLNRSGDRRPLVVTIDRRRAMSIAETKRSLPPTTIAPLPANVVDDVLRHSVVGQMFQGMTGKEVYTYLTMFTVQLQDNITEDAGGVTRSMLSLLCDELMWSYPQQQQQSTVVAPTTDDEEEEERMEPQQAAAIITMSGGKVEPVVPLFIPTDHSTYFNLVPNMKWLATLTTEQEALAMQLYEWLGKLFGNAVLAGTLVYALNFPRLIWKFLAREEATMEDFYADCSDSDRGAINDDDFLLSDEDFYRLPGVRQHHMAAHDQAAATASLMHDDEDDEHDGELVSSDADLVDTPTSPVPGGGEGSGMSEVVRQRIASARRLAASQGLLHQYDKVLEKIRSGFESVVPAAAVEQMRWDDVRQRVSGSDGVTAADILANMDMTSLSASMQAQLTQVVNALAPPARSALLLFATGQRRLPVPEKIRVTCGDDPNELPTAHTCSPISMMLQPYRSTTEFIEKLSLSLAHVYEFGFV